MRVLFVVPYPTEGPSNRYRVEQYLPYLRMQGIECSLRPFISSDFFNILYCPGNNLKKILYFLSASVKRFCDLINSCHYDVIFIHLESFPFGPAIFENFCSFLKKPIVYDFEDAVYLKNFKSENKFMNFLRCPDRFYRILRLSSQVIVCNQYMRELVFDYNRNVTVIPTSIDTEKFGMKNFSHNSRVPVIGWIGSHTTTYCLRSLAKVLSALAGKYNFLLKIVGGAKDFSLAGVNMVNERWSMENDVDNFQSLDIGIYPLPNDERALAKTPFKTIQYMSVGAVPVVSKIGGNLEIVRDGVNGFLASGEQEWFRKLSFLLEEPDLRWRMGIEGRKTVESRYSVGVNAPKFLEVLKVAYRG